MSVSRVIESKGSIYQGAALILISELFLVGSGMAIKQIGDQLPVEMIVFFRNLLGVMLLLPWLLNNGLSAIRTSRLHLHFMRAGVGVVAMGCLFYTWGHLPLAQAALLKQTAPFFMPVLAFFWLGERVGWLVKVSIVIGFSGVYLILNPQEGAFNWVVLVALCGASLGALAKVTVRNLRSTEPARRIVFYFAFFSTLIAFVPAVIGWQPLTWPLFGLLVIVAACSTLAQLLLSKAYGMAPAGQLGPFTYGSVAFAVLLGWFIWDEVLATHTWIGIGLICGAGLVAMLGKARSA
ncbi:DMT family transporter [Aliamphritea hakodatensis]|uniref:DMT family transporter n=1 Tax=Aliamphritea hakodatensis TaxID=2895352 RepID=UPI0022FD4254|nr:DMT family transporter [Aliamphritea hakodatensis]